MSKNEMGRRVYVGDLPGGTSEADVRQALRHYGSLESVWVHGKGAYAFATFAERRDAEEAVRDSPRVNGRRTRLELARNERRVGGGGGGGGRGGGAGGPRNDRCYQCDQRGHYAYECPERNGGGRNGGRSSGGGGGGDRSRRRSRSRSDSRSRSRSRSRGRNRSRSASRDGSSRSRSPKGREDRR